MTIKLLKILAGPEGCHDVGTVLTMNPKKEKAFVKDEAAEFVPENHPQWRPYVGKGRETATDKNAKKAEAEAKAKAEALAAAETALNTARDAFNAAVLAEADVAAAVEADPKDKTLADQHAAAKETLNAAAEALKTAEAAIAAIQ